VHKRHVGLRVREDVKESGNLITIEEFLSEHPADALRYLVLNSGYRNPLTFTPDVLQQAEKALERLAGALKPAMPGASGAPQASLDALEAGLEPPGTVFSNP
jgi:cysteinyl-tRNA synthetase